MIEIYDYNLDIRVILKGKIKEIPKKLGYTDIVSIHGKRFSETVRAVIDLNIVIDYLDENNYIVLKDIFMYSHSALEITDTIRGVSYRGYSMAGDTFSLEDYEDFEKKQLYYKGTINLIRV